MTAFADVLEAALKVEPQAPQAGGFEGAVRAFEAAVAVAPTLSAQVVARPRWAEALDLQLPCTVEDVKRAFRRVAFEAHPDRPNGSHEAFLRANDALEEALSAFRAMASTVREAKRYAAAGSAPESTQVSSSFA